MTWEVFREDVPVIGTADDMDTLTPTLTLSEWQSIKAGYFGDHGPLVTVNGEPAKRISYTDTLEIPFYRPGTAMFVKVMLQPNRNGTWTVLSVKQFEPEFSVSES